MWVLTTKNAKPNNHHKLVMIYVYLSEVIVCFLTSKYRLPRNETFPPQSLRYGYLCGAQRILTAGKMKHSEEFKDSKLVWAWSLRLNLLEPGYGELLNRHPWEWPLDLEQQGEQWYSRWGHDSSELDHVIVEVLERPQKTICNFQCDISNILRWNVSWCDGILFQNGYSLVFDSV